MVEMIIRNLETRNEEKGYKGSDDQVGGKGDNEQGVCYASTTT